MAHTFTPIGRVRLQREAVRTIQVRRTALVHPVFVTGTIVSRQSRTVVLRTSSGNTVTVLTQAVPVAPAVFTVGSTVVLPVQYVNSGLVLMPAFNVNDETALSQQPMLAPCAVNDNDADDAGDTSYYAPPSACENNDGDADDGNSFAIPALPSSFANIPQVFSSSFSPVVAAGFVVSQVGSNVVLVTPDFKPLVVNASPAFSSGAVSGSLSPGRYVVVYGYDVNNTLVATSLM